MNRPHVYGALVVFVVSCLRGNSPVHSIHRIDIREVVYVVATQENSLSIPGVGPSYQY